LPRQLPKGARIYLPDEAARKRHVETRLFEVFGRWGYREVVTPTFEFFETIASGTDQALQKNMFTFVDRETGRMLALRADITPQVARIVATRLRDEPTPIRLCYVTNVFRYDEPQLAHYREFYQAGVELIGLDKPEAEAEVIAMTVEGLRALGLSRFQIDVGHPDFFRGLMEEIRVDGERLREVRAALARKDVSSLERLVGELAPPALIGDALLALPTLFGRAEVLERAARFARNPRSERALGNLGEVHRLLTIYGLADAVLLDLGEVRGFDYYSGVHFEGYADGYGAELCGGGRYDHLLARFGAPCPATGFAFDVNRLLLALEAQGVELPVRGPEVFVIDFTEDKTTALALSRRFRDLGLAVCRDIMSRPLVESLAYAREIRAARALVIDAAGLARGEVRIVDPVTGQEEPYPLRDLMAAPARLLEPARGGAARA
jgi:ATP phosphoribosyltransferase regulatory subunit